MPLKSFRDYPTLREFAPEPANYYENSERIDPAGPKSGSYRVFRGACWFDGAEYCQPSLRRFDFSGSRFYYVGFRVVRVEK